MNQVDPTKNVNLQWTLLLTHQSFLDLKLKFDEKSKHCSVDEVAKGTKRFTYVLPSTCFPKKVIESMPKRVALCLRRICDSDEKFEKHSTEYQSYLISRSLKITGQIKQKK